MTAHAPSPAHPTEWIRALKSEEVRPDRPRTRKLAGHQIAFFRTAEGLHAVDNLCPHEGYPLVQGVVRDCTLTCAWHNFRFDLRDGRSTIGEEDVRSYPVEERDGWIHVNVAEPDVAQAIPKHRRSLERAMNERDFGRIARDVVRLLEAGVAADDVAVIAARFDARRARFGAGHALPLCSDLTRVFPQYPGARSVLPLTHLFDVATEANAHRREHAPVEPIAPGPDLAEAGAALAHAVEHEAWGESRARFQGLLDARVPLARLEDWLWALCSEHFLMFGHGLIYQTKLFPMLERRSVEAANDLLTAHFLQIVVGIRDDTLPTWGAFRTARDELEPELPSLYERQQRAEGRIDVDALAEVLAHGTQPEALAALAAALRAGAPLARICDALALAAAERMLRFDVGHEHDPSVQEGWLDVSHVQTVARATREALERWRDPRALRWLLQSAFFIQTRKPLDAPAAETPAAAPASADDVARLVRAHATDAAVGAAAGHLADGGDPRALRDALIDAVLQGTASRAIYTAHHLKNLIAAFDERESLGSHPRADEPVLAAVRLTASPDAGHGIPQAAREALDFVVDRRKPNALT